MIAENTTNNHKLGRAVKNFVVMRQKKASCRNFYSATGSYSTYFK